MASSYKTSEAATLGTLFTFRVKQIVWEGATTAGHTFQIQDNNGAILFAGVASAANVPVIFDFEARPLVISDFKLTQISSGTIYIYYGF